jgi:hypothetical protein
MKTIFTTFVTDKKWLEEFAKPLANSARYFHPEIPFKIFEGRELENLIPKDYYVKTTCYKAFVGLSLSKEYEHIVFFDADSLIVSKLTELLKEDYEIAGVRNLSDSGYVHSVPLSGAGVFKVPGIEPEQYLNSGLISSKVSRFWGDWIKINKAMANEIFDQDQGTFNRIFYSGNYKTHVLDPIDIPVHYGISSAWDNKMVWNSWGNIQLEDEELFIQSPQRDGSKVKKQIKVLHMAGNQGLGDGVARPPPKDKTFNLPPWQPEVREFLKKICH